MEMLMKLCKKQHGFAKYNLDNTTQYFSLVSDLFLERGKIWYIILWTPMNI